MQRSDVSRVILDVLAIVPLLAFYAWCDQRDVQFWDVGEMQTVPWIFGIAHPTGFPLFTLLGWVFVHTFALGSVAWRMSFFTSIAMCACGWCVYRIVRDECDAPWIGIGAAYVFDATSIAWSRGTRADVHPLAAAFEGAAVYAALRWRTTGGRQWFLGSSIFLGCALAVHPVALFIIPALMLLVFVMPAKPVTSRDAIFASIGFVIPMLTYLTFPFRSAEFSADRTDPTLSLGLPAGMPFWDYGHTVDPDAFARFLSGAQFHREVGLTGYTDPRLTVEAFSFAGSIVLHNFAIPAIVIGLLGFIAYAVHDRLKAVALAVLATAVVPFAFAYAQEFDKERYLFATLFAVASIVGIGFAEIVRRLRAWVPRMGSPFTIVAALVLVCFATWQFYSNLDVINTDRDLTAERYADRVVALTPSDAIVIGGWNYATPLAYLAFVEHRFGDRIIVTSSIEDEASFVLAWSKTRCIAYVAESNAHSFRIGKLHSRTLTSEAPFIYELSNCPSRGGHG